MEITRYVGDVDARFNIDRFYVKSVLLLPLSFSKVTDVVDSLVSCILCCCQLKSKELGFSF